MNVVMMCRRLSLFVAMGMVVVVVVSASNPEPTLLVHPNSHESAIHTSVEGKGSLIREAELDLAKPSPKPKYPPPPHNPGLQQHPTVDSSTIISDSSLMGMVLKRSEEVMEALLVNRFHLRGVENFFRFKSLQPKPKPRPAPKAHYPPPPRSPLATTKARGQLRVKLRLLAFG